MIWLSQGRALVCLVLACCCLAVLSQAMPSSTPALGDPVLMQKIASRTSKCSPQCQQYGTCNEELGRCDCPRHRMGQHCEQDNPSEAAPTACTPGIRGGQRCRSQSTKCLNRCNDRGTCLLGFCHCFPGHFGTDCSLSLDDDSRPQILAGTGYTTRAKRPWVYIYELPPEFNTWRRYYNIDRPAFFYFWQRFLSSGARTADPDKADLFFIPVYMRHPSDNDWLKKAVAYLGMRWPYLNRTGGMARHVVMHGGDWGKMEHPFFNKDKVLGLQQGIKEMIWLTHWGVYQNVHSPSAPPGTKPRESLHWVASHTPGKDVVIPVPDPAIGAGGGISPLHPRKANALVRNVTFFHAGRICGSGLPNTSLPWPQNCSPSARRYSAGVRQRVHAYHWNRTGYMVVPHTRLYHRLLVTSKFCLATQGGGHGNRQVLAAAAGCLPVVIGDHVYQPFEPEMDWTQFGVRVLEEQIPVLHEILAGVDEDAYRRKLAALRCGAQHLMYSSMRGAIFGESGRYDAFETALEIMRAHKDNPGVAPQDLHKVDMSFKRFMACGADDIGQEPPPLQPGELSVCSKSGTDAGQPNSCRRCAHHRFLAGEAHALCCNSPDLATCPRQWQ